MRYSRSRSAGAFTLIEAIAALAITAMIMAALFGVLHATARGAERTRRVLGDDRIAAGIGRLLREDIGRAVGIQRGDVPPLSGGPGRGALSILSVLTTHSALPEGARSSAGLYRAEYFLEPDESRDGMYRLRRRETEHTAAPSANDEGEWLAGGIKDWQLTFWDDSEWVGAWRRRALPSAVRLRLTIQSEDGGVEERREFFFAPQVRPGVDAAPAM